MKRLLPLVAVALLAGCTKAEPIATPDEFADPVRQLIAAVDQSATPTFTAEKCGHVELDGPSDGARRIRSEATVSGDVAKVRTAGVKAGWQPQTATGTELAMRRTLPDGVPMLLTTKAEGSTVRVRISVEHKCSFGGGEFDYGRVNGPEVLPAQAKALDEYSAVAAKVTRRIADAFGATATLSDNDVATDCADGGRSGVRQVLSVSGPPISPKTGTASAAVEKITDALGDGWKATTRAEAKRTVVEATGPGGVAAMILVVGDSPVTNVAIQHFEIPCVPVA